MRLKCPHCDNVLATPRGDDRVRLVKLPVVVIRALEPLEQALETVCTRCRRDVSFPLPLDPRLFRAHAGADRGVDRPKVTGIRSEGSPTKAVG